MFTPEIPSDLLHLRADFYRRNPGSKDWASYATAIPAFLGNNRPMQFRQYEAGEVVEERLILITRYRPTGSWALVPKIGDRVVVEDKTYHVKAIIEAEALKHHNEIELTELDQSV